MQYVYYMKYATITIRVPVDLKKAVESAAKSEDRSLTKYVCRALQAAVKAQSL